MERTEDKQQFVLSFMGQFSSGKSKLINNILKMDLLPVHITETTATITFIQFGEESQGKLRLSDGTTSMVSLEEIKEIWQGNSSAEIKIEDIEYIEIYLNNEFLKSGIILADTPGINTIINKHETLTEELLKGTEEIIYVMSKMVTESDLSMLKKIKEHGIKISFVRTHMDEIKGTEENPEETIIENTEKIKSYFQEENTKIYYVSNEKSSNWYSKINDIRDYIAVELSTNVKENIMICCERKLTQVINGLKEALKIKYAKLMKFHDAEQQEITKEKECIEKELEVANELVKRRLLKLEKDIENVKQVSKEDLEQTKSVKISQYINSLREVSYNADYEKNIKDLSFEAIEEAYESLQENYLRPFEELVSQHTLEINEELQGLGSLMELTEVPLPEKLEDIIVDTQEKDYTSNLIRETLESLIDTVKEREENIGVYQDSVEQLQLIDEDVFALVKDLEMELSELGDYEPQFLETEYDKMQPSQVLKRLGTMVDVATLFIPGKAYTTAAAKAGKVLGKCEKTLKTVGKIAKKADETKDVLYYLKNLKDAVGETRATKKRTKAVINTANTIKDGAKKAGLLDVLTFEFWFEKAGKVFDNPICMEIDREYENAYFSAKNELKERYEKAKFKEIQQKEQLGFFTTEIEKQREIRNIEERKTKELEKELQRRESEIHQKAKEIAFENYKEKYVLWFKKKISELEELILHSYEESISKVMENYKEVCTSGVMVELTRINKEHERIMKLFNNDEKNNLNMEIDKCKTYKDILGDDNGIL